ncbi:hypothetical protein BACCIP111895_00423 [Neobacillus rhizosphaerae]|uniref:Uncharacterized protein n=1 Tax=Neobacillus rhizosphaerae TaxID=2880965 RepID=A0ABN8KIP5_9BACI|nr:acyl carrier protein [Neobacillus rhizosphaerae]CAH2713288.1 hypothetical protein BACCIP111895_00423 [Neobacillus rhizosphaerae]
MLKKKVLFVFLLCLVILTQAVQPTKAEGSFIKISVKEGYAGKVKSGRGFPVQVTVENSGADFTGDILFNFASSYNSNGAKVLSIDVPKGSKKTYSLSLPAFSEEYYNNNTQVKQSIFLYKGSWKDDHEQAFIGDKKLKPKYIDQGSRTLGMLSEDSDRLKELKVMATSNQIETIVLTEEMIPDDELGLDSLDYIMIDEFGISKLKNTKQQAILKWVQNGGKLIAGAAPNAAGSYGSLYQVLPMKPDKEVLTDTKFFQATPTLPPFKDIPVFVGQLDKGANVAVKSGDLPMVVHKGYGSGEIWQTAFSLGDEPLSSWKDYGHWFAVSPMLKGTSTFQFQKGGPNPFDMLFNEFAEVNEYFASSQFSIGQISLFLLVYLLLLVPFLYFLLKRLDKREHAWWIIMGVAFISSVGIFVIGAKDRIAKPQMNQTGIYKTENGQLNGFEAVTFLSNTGGDYQLDFSKGKFYGVPGSSMMPVNDGKRYAVLENGRKTNSVTFPNVEYWSTRTYFGQASKQNAGQFDINLSYENKKLSGKIVNHFPYDFEELYIWSGGKKIKVGPVKSGESVSVNETMQQDYLAGPYSQGNSYKQPTSQQEVDELKREKMEYAAIEFLYNNSQSENQPILYGYTKDSVIKADIKGKNEARKGLSLIYQTLNIQTKLSGSFTIKDDMLKNHINTIRGGIINDMTGRRNEMELDDGEYDYVLELPSQLAKMNRKLKELEITWQGANVTYSLLNHKTGTFLPLPKSHTTIKEHLDQYISEDGAIIIKLIKAGQGDPLVRMPELSIKGEINS